MDTAVMPYSARMVGTSPKASTANFESGAKNAASSPIICVSENAGTI